MTPHNADEPTAVLDGDQLDELMHYRGLADSLRGSLQQRKNYLQTKSPN